MFEVPSFSLFAPMWRATRMPLAAIGLVAIACGPAQAQVVHVTAKIGAKAQEGTGILFNSAGRCYALTPAHVVESKDDTADKIDIILREGTRASATVDRVMSLADLAALSVQINVCNAPPPTAGITSALDALPTGFLQIVPASGGLRRLPVNIVSIERDVVRVTASSGALSEGMSGSVLLAGPPGGELQVGMLLRVEGKEGVAVRLDMAASLLGDLWQRSSASAGASSAPAFSSLAKHAVQVDVQVTQTTRRNGTQWDQEFPTLPSFYPPDPLVYVRFADASGEGVVIGYESVRTLDRAALSAIGMALNDPCGNVYSCSRTGEVRGEIFDEVIVFDNDPQPGGMANYEEIGRAKGCKINTWCNAGGARVRITATN